MIMIRSILSAFLYLFLFVSFLVPHFGFSQNTFVDRDVKHLDFEVTDDTVFHLISHGRSGELLIEGKWLDAEGLVAWFQSTDLLSNSKYLNIYGCEFGFGAKGAAAIQLLESHLAMTIAASDDITGVDGDWELEIGTSQSSMHSIRYSGNLQVCECSEMIYLNEIPNGGPGAVHKYEINPDGSVTEILAPGGSAWYVGTDLPRPHGLGGDLNGNLYIGGNASATDIRKLRCDGELLSSSEFFISSPGLYNIGSIGNQIYYNDRDFSGIKSANTCTGVQGDRVQFCSSVSSGIGDWGFYIDPKTQEMYATRGFTNPNAFWYFDQSDFDSDPTTCVMETTLTNFPQGGADVRGVVTDADRNVYIAVYNDNGGSYLMKYGPAPTFNYIGMSVIDSAEDGMGYRYLIGLVYSYETNLIYGSTTSIVDDCIAIFDTDLNYLNTAVPAALNGSNAKGIALTRECCLTQEELTVDTMVCAEVGEVVFLQQLIGCEGIICEGAWSELPGVDGLTFDVCDNSITIDSPAACGSFTMASDGTGSTARCGAFEITLNIGIGNLTASVLNAVQPSCDNSNDPPAITSTLMSSSGAVTYQWQMSFTDCDNGFTDIAGAVLDSYDPPVATQVTYYRLVTSVEGCTEGLCTESACVTLTPESDCCPTENCLDMVVQKN